MLKYYPTKESHKIYICTGLEINTINNLFIYTGVWIDHSQQEG